MGGTIISVSHQFREECGSPVSEVSGLTMIIPVTRSGWCDFLLF
ncbi:hypothetical protein BRYFOR_05957 [Marvinbryantia formatexigens DSM 14469]|uniref:Uncharacterized protein n=1 Tax=Marvinbryantia formatexigens DSM 14469 TaxID=478749 RepID=C6LBG2_9FIRM|nr:hypothetical protein BRYFOR_05957 [Marvinbryantia formatexigens DSM 14469]